MTRDVFEILGRKEKKNKNKNTNKNNRFPPTGETLIIPTISIGFLLTEEIVKCNKMDPSAMAHLTISPEIVSSSLYFPFTFINDENET